MDSSDSGARTGRDLGISWRVEDLPIGMRWTEGTLVRVDRRISALGSSAVHRARGKSTCLHTPIEQLVDFVKNSISSSCGEKCSCFSSIGMGGGTR